MPRRASPAGLVLEDGPRRADDPLGRPPADAPLRRSCAADGRAPERSSARTRASRSSPAYGCGLAGAPGVPGLWPPPMPGRASAAAHTVDRFHSGDGAAPGSRAVGVGLGEVAQAAVGRGSRRGWRSPSCGPPRRRRPGRPGRPPGRPGSATRSCPAGTPGARRSTRPRTSSRSGRSARPSPGGPSWPVPGTSRRPCSGGTPRAAMSARLITGRPLIAGIENYLPSAGIAAGARSRPDLASSSGRPRES